MNKQNTASLDLHRKHRGKLEIRSKVPLYTVEDLSLAYSPGVAEPCRAISRSPESVYEYTTKGNMVAVVTDGSAVLGLGDIGPSAALPVMEGKAILFKAFAGVDAVPICLDVKDTDEIVRTIKHIAPAYGGINLEDIAAPRCIDIERRLRRELDIPVFHDDQHGTAIVVAAGLINACRLTNRKIEDLNIVLCGTGAAGNAIARMLRAMNVSAITAFNRSGPLRKDKVTEGTETQKLFEEKILDEAPYGAKTLEDMLEGADVFIGVSIGGLLEASAIKRMNQRPILFPLANPTPEVDPQAALEHGAAVIGTGRSDYPNQINNVLAFPGIFKGTLAARAADITEPMKKAAAKAIADLVGQQLSQDYIVPSPFDGRVARAVADAVARIAREG